MITLMVMTFLSNLISGYIFVYLLKYVGSQLSTINAVELTAYVLLMNRLGRFLAISFEFKKTSFFMRNDHIFFSFCLFISIAILSFSTINLTGLSAFFLGLGMSGITIAQRWRISELKNEKINVRYVIVSTIAWGVGILIPTWLSGYQNLFQNIIFILSILLVLYWSEFFGHGLSDVCHAAFFCARKFS